jgi:TPR repeat protein
MRYIIGGKSLVGEEYRGLFEKDPSKAKSWLEKAASQGYQPAREDLKKYFG